MIKKIKLIFPEELIKEPILYRLGKDFPIVYNIHAANVEPDKGWVILSLEGEEKDIERAIMDLEKKGVKIERR